MKKLLMSGVFLLVVVSSINNLDSTCKIFKLLVLLEVGMHTQQMVLLN